MTEKRSVRYRKAQTRGLVLAWAKRKGVIKMLSKRDRNAIIEHFNEIAKDRVNRGESLAYASYFLNGNKKTTDRVVFNCITNELDFWHPILEHLGFKADGFGGLKEESIK